MQALHAAARFIDRLPATDCVSAGYCRSGNWLFVSMRAGGYVLAFEPQARIVMAARMRSASRSAIILGRRSGRGTSLLSRRPLQR